VFCTRGAAENLIKDMERFTRSEKTACSRWQANQFRLSCTWEPTGCCILCGTRHPGAHAGAGLPSKPSVASVRIAVRVEELKGKIKLAFPASYPETGMLAAMTGSITMRGP
jgi:hypothetical protein